MKGLFGVLVARRVFGWQMAMIMVFFFRVQPLVSYSSSICWREITLRYGTGIER